ncbi:MAG: dephospho-CoA kinase [candidate division Zixibacteria bacterium]|nr:dephospho-CoA kinase [candidate division Zixibacteria bacterium]
MIIGLTGQIGAGKTSAADIFRELGAIIVDADRIGRDVVEQSPALLKKLVKTFGEDIVGAKGKLRRKQLATVAFRDKDSRDKLNRLVHPYLLKELWRQVRAADRNRLVVIDAALLLHWQMDRKVDFVLVIHAGLQIRLNRLRARGITREDALARQRAQLSFSEYQKKADRVILNNRTPAILRRKIIALFQQIVPQTD